MDERERLKKLKITSSVNNHVGTTRAELLKRDCLPGFAREFSASLRVGEQLVETVSQHDHQQIKDDLAVACRRQFLQQPTATLELLIILLNFRAL